MLCSPAWPVKIRNSLFTEDHAAWLEFSLVGGLQCALCHQCLSSGESRSPGALFRVPSPPVQRTRMPSSSLFQAARRFGQWKKRPWWQRIFPSAHSRCSALAVKFRCLAQKTSQPLDVVTVEAVLGLFQLVLFGAGIDVCAPRHPVLFTAPIGMMVCQCGDETPGRSSWSGDDFLVIGKRLGQQDVPPPAQKLPCPDSPIRSSSTKV